MLKTRRGTSSLFYRLVIASACVDRFIGAVGNGWMSALCLTAALVGWPVPPRSSLQPLPANPNHRQNTT